MKKTLAVLAASAALVLTAALPAHAATRSLVDRDETSPARADITALRVTNGEKRVVGVVSLRTAVRGKTTLGLLIRVRRGPAYGAWTVARKDGQRKLFVTYKRDEVQPMRCRGWRVRINERRDVVRFSVPHRCLGDSHRALRVVALSEDHGGGDVDDTRTLRVPRA